MLIKKAAFFCVFVFLTGCISKAPKTTFYTLSSISSSPLHTDIKSVSVNLASVGVGPITLPEYMRKNQIVSFTDQSQLQIASNSAWAGDVNANLTRVITAYLSELNMSVFMQSFPWDSRARPEYQLLIRFNEFGGMRGKHVTLSANWQLINTKTKKLEKQAFITVVEPITSSSTQDYIAGMNRAVKKISIDLSKAMQI